ncbi:MAG TPA: hypothetical protein VGM98_10480 [Schlesneria sp.]|jgi:hypothetical protein
MSNARIVGQLSALADELELGQIRVSDFANQLCGHTEALDRMQYVQLKEAQTVQAQLRIAIEQGEEQVVNVHRVGDWLRAWIAQVPID